MSDDLRRKRLIFSATDMLAVALFSVLLTLCSLLFAHEIVSLQYIGAYLGRSATFVLNWLPALLWILAAYFATGRVWLAMLLTTLPVMAITWVNYYKLLLRNDPLLFSDITLIGEAKAMSGRYSFQLNGWMIAVALLLIALIVLACRLLRKRPKPRAWLRVVGSFACVGLLVASMFTLYPDKSLYQRTGFSGDWVPTQTYIDHGVLYPFLHSVSEEQTVAPSNYSQQETENLLAKYTDEPLAKKPHIIAVMLEAFSDFGSLVDFDRDPYAAFRELCAESYHGSLVTSIFAGGTIDTERCFLTGCLSVPALRRNTDSFVRYFRSQGYETTGCHPWYEWFYNRVNVDAYLGFNSYWFNESRFSTDDGQPIIDNPSLFAAILEDYRANLRTGKPLFSFNVTYQNHGPYSDEQLVQAPYLPWKEQYAQAEYNIANNYFDGMRETCEQLLAFKRQLENESEPIVLILFGDHKPWLGDKNSVYDMLGVNLDVSTREGFRNYYTTPYLIWANTAAKQDLGVSVAGEGRVIGPYFLLPTYFQLIGEKADAFNQCLTSLMEETAFVNRIAYEDDGALRRRGEPDEADFVHTLECLSYARLTTVCPSDE